MKDYFNSAVLHNVDCYAADYTNMTHKKRGVVISETPFTDIAYFHLQNPKSVEYWSINFEEELDFFRKDEDKLVSQCEAMFVSKSEAKGWLLLLELKYCSEENIGANRRHAYQQIESTYRHLKKKGVIPNYGYNIYWNCSIPDHSSKEPFPSFRYTAAEKVKMKKKGIQILGYNTVLINNGDTLSVMPKNLIV